MMSLPDLMTGGVYTVMLVFMRMGTALMLLPGFGDMYVPAHFRLYLGLGLSFVLTPLLQPLLPAAPPTVAGLAILLLTEIGLGIFMGTVSRMFLSALETAGSIISMQTGLASAAMFNPQMAGQSSAIGTFLTMTGVVLIFVTNLHHMLLNAVLDSYSFFPPGTIPDSGDLASAITRVAAESFQLGVQLAAPYLLLGFVFFWGLGLLARLMPQVQVFLIALPVQILLGLFILAATLAVIFDQWLMHFSNNFLSFLRTTGF